MDSRPNDETLLLAVAERDMGAFRALYERHAGWLATRLARPCNDRDLVAEDQVLPPPATAPASPAGCLHRSGRPQPGSPRPARAEMAWLSIPLWVLAPSIEGKH